MPPAKKTTTKRTAKTVNARSRVVKTTVDRKPAAKKRTAAPIPQAGRSTRVSVNKEAPPAGRVASQFTEIGASGLQVVGGRVNEEFLPILRGERGIRMWREMGDNDPYSGALLYGVMQTVLRAEWTVDDNGAPDSECEFLEQCRDDMSHPFRDVVAEAMSMGQYGWAFLETVMKLRSGPDAAIPSDYSDGRIGWRKMPLRAQETLYQWIVDYEEGSIIGMRQRLWGTELDLMKTATVDIPIDKGCLYRTTHHKGNPEGRSMLRSGWVPYDKRKKIEVYEGIGVERDLAGIPVIYLPAEMLSPKAPNDMKSAVAEFHRIAKNLRVDDQSHVIMPAEYDENGNNPYKIELMSPPGKKQFDTNVIINRLAVAQLMSIMADVMMIGHEAQGSRALASVKDEMFTSGIQSLLDECRDMQNNFAIPRLYRLNGIKPPFPQYSTSPIQRVDPGEFVANVLSLAQSGMPLWPDDELDGYIRDFLGWPARSNPGLGMDVLTEDEPIEPDPTITQKPTVTQDAPITAPKTAPKTSGAPKAATPAKEAASQGATAKRTKKPVDTTPKKTVPRSTVRKPAKKVAARA